MDTSEIYIKQCEKAKEIQKLRSDRDCYRNWKNGDFFWATILGSAVPSRYKTGVEVVMRLLDRYSMMYCPGEKVWLPRQDQLQEMVTYIGGRWVVEQYFHNYLHSIYTHDRAGEDKDSMEQLWLAFVMREEYGKIWNGKTWVKEA